MEADILSTFFKCMYLFIIYYYGRLANIEYIISVWRSAPFELPVLPGRVMDMLVSLFLSLLLICLSWV